MGRHVFTALFAVAAVLASGCATVRPDENLERIEEAMRPEQYSEATPGAEGIWLGGDAPPLAEGDSPAVWGRSGGHFIGGVPWRRGFIRGGRGWSPPPQADPAQPFGGGTLGRGPPNPSGNFPGGGVGGGPRVAPPPGR